ncbi:DUF4175 family protein [Flagellimonas meishanensis]|uniref:DUF4175 family protein n=1 Tax=Flagellimonas meishanensis TaxID=2873264 RepID=UPI00223B93E1|nr:DUF4175 family protein [[Muricauda] meishanensis]
MRKGLTEREASRLIGIHFPEVGDKLQNLLDLTENKQRSELLLASIEQRAKALGPVPFSEAVDLKEGFRHGRYVLLPIAVLGFIWVSGNIASFFNSHQRVVNYDMAFERPAPFQFRLMNDKLEILDTEPLTILAGVDGDMVPEDMYIVINGERLLMKRQGEFFAHTIDAPVLEGSFFLTANGWDSRGYDFRSLPTPSLLDFEMKLNFPKYLGRDEEAISGTGNAIVPEGTLVTWTIKGKNVDEIGFVERDTTEALVRSENEFVGKRRIFNDLEYQLSTSNFHVKAYEKLEYALQVIKDRAPTVKVEQYLDSLSPNVSFYTGQASDDYGIREVRVICYPVDDRSHKQELLIESPSANVHQFYYTFPSGMRLEEGRSYELYFEVIDNDGIRGGKTARSQVFRTKLYNVNELINKELDAKNALIRNMDRELKNYKEQEETLSEINRDQKEERTLSFENKDKIKKFLEKQEEQERLFEKFSSQLQKGLEKQGEDSEMKRLLQERLERQEKEARKNEKLLEELNKLADKIEKENLQKRLEELGKKQSSQARNLEQILELTKRYYVTEKAAQLAKELDELSKEQGKLANEIEKNTLEEQGKLNERFDKTAEELEELRKDNASLKKPTEIEVSKKDADQVKGDQQSAKEHLEKGMKDMKDDEKGSNGEAKKKQKAASDKMKEMSEKLEQGASGAGGSSVTEDAEMLRQILDNLVTFSFKQEALFDELEASDFEIGEFSGTVREQKELRRMFEHVDDSLFSLSLRRAELSEFVNEQITEVYYNIDKSLESIAEDQMYQGASYQQYVMNATNVLADFLANILENMQQNMSMGSGKGSGSDFQLPDIIKGQEGIQQKMDGSGEGNKGQESQQQGKEGQGEKQGEGTEGESPGGNDGRGQGKDGENDNRGAGNGEQEGGYGQDELGLNEIYEIYKEQQYLRQQLENQLQDMINNDDRNLTKKLLRQMEDFENDLLENGITERTRSKSTAIQSQLLKLENAVLKQGEENERESNTNKSDFSNPITTKPELLKEQQNNIEILNRQALPLRQNYERKVKVYFKND